jgi:hypothetical protein
LSRPEEFNSVSRLSYPSNFEQLREIKNDPRILIALGLLHCAGQYSVINQASKTTDWLKVDKTTITLNNPEIQAIEQPAALGITKARDLAKLFSLKLDGKLISSDIVDQFAKPQFKQIDFAIKAPIAKGYGFMYESHPMDTTKWLYGHPGKELKPKSSECREPSQKNRLFSVRDTPKNLKKLTGYGGSTVMMNKEDQVVIAYLTNGLKLGGGELTYTYRRLRNATLKCIYQLKST